MGRADTVDCGDLYERVRAEFAALASSVIADELATVVPAAPEWQVRDVLAHVVGLAADLNAARFPHADDAGAVAWTARQVASRRGLPVLEVLAEWDREAPVFADGLRLFGYEMGSHFVGDLVVHLHDVQAALGCAPFAEPLVLAVALDHYTGFLHEGLVRIGWGALTVSAGDDEWTVGEGSPRASVEGAAYETLRSLCARRSVAQIHRLSWTGDVDAFLAALPEIWTGGYALPRDDQP